jgi:arylsulfatase A-like enzyme
MWNKKMLPAPRRVKEPVQLIDLMPTLLEITGVRRQGIMQGVSVVPLTKGAALTRKQPVMSSRFRYAQCEGCRVRAGESDGDFRVDRFAVAVDFARRPEETSLPAVELYDRRADPSEAKNLAAQRPEVAKKQWARSSSGSRRRSRFASIWAMRANHDDPQTRDGLKSTWDIGK